MELYTIQIAKAKRLKDTDIEFIDITVKSGDKRLAPTWDMVMRVKDYLQAEAKGQTPPGTAMSPEHFTALYRKIIQQSITLHRAFWVDLVQKPRIALGCYCNLNTDGHRPFCHRLILATYIKHLCKLKGIPVEYKGEYE